ncbi:unnamed protein product [Symbiodinium natans]|uniref:Uncharacterized protein n=1 Tax=Symbiodinium natans TaxID=878477 RepID=A0A812IAE3_9DINO|nr:unnamed protein product [Symbiodinium natans]
MDVNLEIMRGISLRKCLRNVRNLWWASPLDLPEKIRSNLWKKSASVSGFDVFLSHTWQSSGLRKCLALLLQSTWMWGLAFWLFILLLLMIIYMQNLLPTPSGYSLPQRYGGGTVPQGPWMAIFSLPSCLFGLALAVYLPERIWQSPTCFLDAVSIHQTDQGLMKQGVYGLGGFLKASKELRILWSAPYFSRLWCIFELAAYRTANPTGKITLAPVFVESAVAAYFVASYLACVSFTLDRQSFLFLSLVGQMVSTYILIWYLRRNLSVKRKLISDLQNFDIAQAQCRLQYDRDFVLDAITDWFGSQEAFTDYVRGNLGKAATSGLLPLTVELGWLLPVLGL